MMQPTNRVSVFWSLIEIGTGCVNNLSQGAGSWLSSTIVDDVIGHHACAMMMSCERRLLADPC